MAILTMQTVLSQARTLLNDDAGQQWPDAVLVPKIQLAHQELQTTLWDAGSPTVRAMSPPILIPANTTGMTGLLPTDYLTVFSMMESTSPSLTGQWVPMTEVFRISQLILTGVTPGTTLKFYCNIQDGITFLGSVAPNYVIMDYRRSITVPVASADSLGIPFAEHYLAPRTAALAGGVMGDANSLKELTAMSVENLTRVVRSNRGKQTSATKP